MFQTAWHTVFGNWPMTKRNMFVVILLSIGITSAVFSLLTRFTVLDLDYDNPVKVAVVAPLTGQEAPTGEAMVRGAELAAERINAAGGIRGKAVMVEQFDDQNTVDGAIAVANEVTGREDIVTVIGHGRPDTIKAAELIYEAAKLPFITAAPTRAPEDGVWRNWVFDTLFNQLEQTQFLANYLRNVVGQETVSIIHEDTAEGRALADAFDQTYRRFGTKVLNFWPYDPTDLENLYARGEEIAEDMRDRKLSGHVFLQGGAAQSARIATALRENRVRNGIVGLSPLATTTFIDEVKSVLTSGEPAGLVTNGMFVTTPLLFDTATEVAQNFRVDYAAKYDTQPDWRSAFTFDATQLAINGIIADIGLLASDDVTVLTDIGRLRNGVRDYLSRINTPERSARVVGGERYFGEIGTNTTPVQIGLYNGESMISALTQLQPIKERGVTGFLDLVQQGKVLYVNDRFMYRTNVVYTGVQLLNAEEIWTEDGEESRVLTDRFKLDFLIWFRYRGDFSPEDIVFLNAVEPITLTEPDKQGVEGDLKYVSYRVSGDFKVDFSDIRTTYGKVVAGLGFHHRLLSRNNLMYVTDVLGMGLAESSGLGALDYLAPVQDESDGLLSYIGLGGIDLAALFSTEGSGDPLLDGLSERQVFGALPHWEVERAWISQEIYEGTGEGDPSFVGYGKQAPDFTRIDLGVILGPSGVDPAAVIPYNWFVYLLIFGIVALVFASIMDRKERGQFWRFQTLGIRVIGWPTILVAAGTLTLDYSSQNLPDGVTDAIVMFFATLWWLIPARLLAITIERFLWVPIEERSGRRIPNVVRLFAAGSIYLLAIFGVVAFVMDQKLTSLLATSGLLAMIIGLAIQANIANIFSGIVLNIERPFKVGDWVMLGDTIGEVTDITWRTMRLRSRDGFAVSIPNGQVSETMIQNFSAAELARFSAEFFLPERYMPAVIEESIARAEGKIRAQLVAMQGNDEALDDYTWRYDGVKVFEPGLFHRYRVDFWIDHYPDFEVVRDLVYQEVFKQFHEDGIDQTPVPMEISLMRGSNAERAMAQPSMRPAGSAAE